MNAAFHASRIISQASATKLTSEAYPALKRGEFGTVTDADVHAFKDILPGEGRVLTEMEDVEAFNVDWQGKFRGQSKVVLKPKSTEEVSRIMKHCYEHNLAVVPQGGNTGLVGGSVPVFDEVIINLGLMKEILDFDPISGIIVAESGCVLEDLDNYLAEKGYMMPLDLGAKGSCQIGGNVSTNAGGLRLVRYGSLHGSVMGIEVVLPDGEVMSTLAKLRKDNTGYDLKQLFIGAEGVPRASSLKTLILTLTPNHDGGTLGIVTGVSILTPIRPTAVNVALVACKSYEDVIATSQGAKSKLSEAPT